MASILPGRLLLRLGLIGLAGAVALRSLLRVEEATVAVVGFGVLLIVSPAAILALGTSGDAPRALVRAARGSAAASSLLFLSLTWALLVGTLLTAAVVTLAATGAAVWLGLRAVRRDTSGATQPDVPAGFYSLPLVAAMAALAAVLVPFFQACSLRFSCDRQPAYAVAMKYDLRNLVSVQEVAFADSGRYTANPADPTAREAGQPFRASPGVLGPSITLTPDGWTARVGHVASTMECVVYVGSTPIAPATHEGEPGCTGDIDRARRERRRELLVFLPGLAIALVGLWRVHAGPGGRAGAGR